MSKLKTIIIFTAVACVLFYIVESILLNFLPSFAFEGHILIPIIFGLLYTTAVVLLPREINIAQLADYVIGIITIKAFVLMFFMVFALSHLPSVIFVFFLYYIVMFVPEFIFFIKLENCKKIRNEIK